MADTAVNGHGHGQHHEPAYRSGSPAPTDASDGNRLPMQEPSRDLTSVDVASLIINKMIGTGIFTSPFTVLINCENKTTALCLWLCGFVYTILSMFMYMEFARKLPFTGGELVYLDDVMPGYSLLTSTLYAFYFVFVYTTSTNAMYFGAQVLLATSGKTNLQDLDLDDNQQILRFLSVVVTTVVCLVLYLSSSKSRLLNMLTALGKVALLLIICAFGCRYLSQRDVFATEDHWTRPRGKSTTIELHTEADSSRRTVESNWQAAFITILFSFHGWENATLVSGEIPSFSVLRKGTIYALAIVGSLYLTIAVLVSLAFQWPDSPYSDNKGPVLDKNSTMLENYTAVFLNVAGNQESAAVATAIITAVSAVGSMISVTYTCVRVKQSIAWTNILPFSFIWRRSGPLRPRYQLIPSGDRNGGRSISLSLSSHDPYAYLGTPEGGIMLHWIVTVFYICVTAAINDPIEAIGFSAMLLVYGHFFMEALVALGFIWFDPVDRQARPIGYPAIGWSQDNSIHSPAWWTKHAAGSNNLFKNGSLQVLLGVIIFLFSVGMVIVDSWHGSRGPERKDFVRFIITTTLMILGALYWLAFVNPRSSNIVYRWFNHELELLSHGKDDNSDAERVCRFFQIPGIELRDRPHHGQPAHQSTEVLQQAEALEHRHTHFGYCKFVSLKAKHDPAPSSNRVAYP
ncbi:hypothetical protein LX36DRAFT_379650 [Colletotrichum falcatum]|nr:hypothetical protein LX36DRAFT_379650 [Colletotrichum falcatum]